MNLNSGKAPLFFDNHAHINFAAYAEDRAEVVERTLESGTWVVNVGTQLDTSRSAVELAREFNKGMYATVGLHPIHTTASFHDTDELGDEGKAFNSRGEVFDMEAYLDLAKDEKVLGIGETGLDYYRLEEESIKRQKEDFSSQIALANEVDKPLMLHIRPGKGGEAYKDALEILRTEAKVIGDVHFFAGTTEEAKMFLDLGYYISFTGVITFASEYRELVDFVPLDRILSETDCPYVTPAPHRGKRNEPMFVSEVVRAIAEIKGLNEIEAGKALVSNALRFWNLPTS